MNIVFYLHDEQNSNAIEKKLLWFKNHYNIISNKDLIDAYYNGKLLKNSCHLTIDDGWISTYNIVFPLLKKYDIPITIFVSPKVSSEDYNFWYYEYKGCDEDAFKAFIVEKGYFDKRVLRYPLDLIFKELPIDAVYTLIEDFGHIHDLPKKERGFVNTEQLKEMQASGLVEIGAHTMIHPILASENKDRSAYEISQSIIDLSELLKKPITSFAYPNGLKNLDFGTREMDMVKECGIKLAFSVDPGNICIKNNPLSIPRVGSQNRLLLGKLGLLLPSLHNQAAIRENVRECSL